LCVSYKDPVESSPPFAALIGEDRYFEIASWQFPEVLEVLVVV